MYAVIETGGKQYKVAVGDKLKVEKLTVAEGESMDLERVLMIADGDQVTIGTPLLENQLENRVTATVVGHGRARKIKVFKMKRRKNYRRTQGHRQAFTEIEITGIGEAPSASEAPEKKATVAIPAHKQAAAKKESKAAETTQE